jgi:sulfatase maturation enzyme AslB (radical SAM superfamily)
MAASDWDLSWIDDFIHRVKPYIFVRESDSVLIRVPNHAMKLNQTGTRILSHLLSNGRIDEVLNARSHDPDSRKQIHLFFSDLARVLDDRLCDRYDSPAIQRIPFELGYIELPVLSEIAITYRCNIRCAFCYAACHCTGSESSPQCADGLDTQAMKKILHIIRYDAETPSVSFTGGEPLLRGDLPELIAYSAGVLKMRVNLITNGTHHGIHGKNPQGIRACFCSDQHRRFNSRNA